MCAPARADRPDKRGWRRHRSDDTDNMSYEDNNNGKATPQPATAPEPATPRKKHAGFRIMFGLFMIFIYVSMGVLVLMGYFDWLPRWAQYGLGTLFIIYGLWRGYRHFAGIDTRI